ncbi:glycosyltransferase family 4 protein [Vibrio cyclitrophicus]
MKKIIHIIGNSEYGGGSKVVESIIKGNIEDKFEVSVLTTNQQMATISNDLGATVVDIDCIKTNISPFSDFYGIFKLYFFLKKNNYNIVHTHTTKAGMIGRIAAFLSNSQVVVHTIHGFAFSENSSKKKVIFYSFVEKLCALLSHKVVTVSEYHKKWAIDLGICNSEKVMAIPNGLASDFSLGTSVRKKSEFIFIGRLVKEKGINDLILAFDQIYRDNPRVQLKLIGDGPDKQEFESLVSSLQLEKSVIFTGFTDNVKEHISDNSIFVLPSYREGFSISLLEAMSMRLPIIATNLGGNLEASDKGKCALLYPVGDVGKLSDCMRKAIRDENLCSEISNNAHHRFTLCYTERGMISSYSSLYRELGNHH